MRLAEYRVWRGFDGDALAKLIQDQVKGPLCESSEEARPKEPQNLR